VLQSREGPDRANHVSRRHRAARAGMAGAVAKGFSRHPVPVAGVADVLVGLFRQPRATVADRPPEWAIDRRTAALPARRARWLQAAADGDRPVRLPRRIGG